MMTAKRIERWWKAGRWEKLLAEVSAGRAGAAYDRLRREPGPVSAAALGLIRLIELGQDATPTASMLVRELVARQLPDGRFGDDVAVTAVAVRALMLAGGGKAAEHGADHLRQVQRDDGSFPDPAVRRMPADAEATAAVAGLLVDLPVGLDFEAALAWLTEQGPTDFSVPAMRARRALVSAV